jgi:hypothetical protein
MQRPAADIKMNITEMGEQLDNQTLKCNWNQ